jgi:hypothetical protein
VRRQNEVTIKKEYNLVGIFQPNKLLPLNILGMLHRIPRKKERDCNVINTLAVSPFALFSQCLCGLAFIVFYNSLL